MPAHFELDDLTRPEVIRLLEEHLEDMYAASPAESVHALDLEALRAPGISFWSAWEETELVACGALKSLGDGDYELKSMRTTAAARGRGIATALLRHLVEQARSRGAGRLLLETGTEDLYEPARRLYRGNGFTERPPFGSYVLDPSSVFFELSL
ncbi:putative acetyltransferase [Nocardioides albertanoniae]|uniref:Putative acetyltransferase n=1 Tax=Nocardioides albertanoniae TaxID=1175486 RepID=A0A543A7S3_9ACTN|nr:GNAT family N-acetyltransferase [Nocardioides albertanoniae]TQL68653.1 putative acetyltransferase [Nocardioides albertanoniae]